MRRSGLILCAASLDWVLGDPEWAPHPVRVMGRAIAGGERMLRRPGDGPRRQVLAGAALALGLTGLSYLLARAAVSRMPAWAPLLAATSLAARNLDDEARAVLHALDAHDLPRARVRLARIVGRDTGELHEAGISRALIETLAESLCDGFVAPLLFLALGGVPAAMSFKAVSTMDSMIGHRSERFLHFGRVAARLDDAANFVPARMTALALLGAGSALRAPRSAAAVYLRDRGQHASPNAGHPEAAMAGVLGVELGGASSYDGEPHHTPLLGAGQPLPTANDARKALHMTRIVAIGASLLAAMLLRKKR